MVVRKVSFPLSLTAVAVAGLVALLSWSGAHAATPVGAIEGTIQQTMPMTDTMPMDHAMPAQGDEHADHAMPAPADMPASHDMPAQPAAGQGGMGGMMANMAKMQQTMARMQRMMAGSMMAESMPMSGTMPMAGMMGGDTAEMMDMMAEMQEMMAEMQGMMAGEMMAGGMPMGGQLQGQQMQGQTMQGGMPMMGQMPMMGTMIIVAPMPMGGMMQQQGGMGMMGQMPMMQGMMSGGMMSGGMDMGGMMGGGMMGPGAAAGRPETAGPGAAAATGSDEQSGKLGAIDVKVTPPDLSNIQGDTIDFTVDLNATGTDLGLDLASLATLKIGDHEMPATAWTVKLDHGHHVNGILSFPAHMSGPVESATLTVTDPEGGAALALTWPAAE